MSHAQTQPDIAQPGLRLGPLPTDCVFHGTDKSFNEFEMSDCLGAHFGTRQAAQDRLSTTGRLKIQMQATENDDGGWIVEEFRFTNEDPIEHGPFEDESCAKTFMHLADPRREPLGFELDIGAPLILPDLGMWAFNTVFAHLSRIGLFRDDAECDAVWDEWLTGDARGWAALRNALQARGYDSIAYINDVEDKHSMSWIALDPRQITPADTPEMRERMPG